MKSVKTTHRVKMPYLLVIRGVDKVSAGLIICVQELEGSLLVHGTHAKLVPSVTNATSSKLQWRYSYARKRAEHSVTTKGCRWLRRWRPKRHCLSMELRYGFCVCREVSDLEELSYSL